jgi:hypothetical protein
MWLQFRKKIMMWLWLLFIFLFFLKFISGHFHFIVIKDSTDITIDKGNESSRIDVMWLQFLKGIMMQLGLFSFWLWM